MWGLETDFADIASKKDERSVVTLTFNSSTYQGWVTSAKKGRTTPAYRLWFDDSLSL